MTDNELMEWANAHPNDSRAERIKGNLRVQELGQHGNAMQRLDYMGSAGGPVIKGALAAAGTALGGPIGGGIGNVVGGVIDRAGTDSLNPQGSVASDFAWGAGPPALLKGIGAGIRSFGRPALAKAVGYFMGKPTAQAAEEGGVALPHVGDPQLEQILGADTPLGSQKIAGEFAKQEAATLPQATTGQFSMSSRTPYPGASTAPGSFSQPGEATTLLSRRPSPIMSGGIADNAAELEQYAAPQSKLAAVTEQLLGNVADGPGRAVARAIGGSSSPGARYLSALAQASQRSGMVLAPEMQKLLASSPGQQLAMPTLSSLIAQYSQRN